MIVVAAAPYDMDQGVRQSEHHLVFSNAPGNDQSAYFPSIDEDCLRQFDLPFEFIVDESAVFETLAREWRQQRGATSSITEMVLCPAYQSIIGMGPRAIRFIVAELRAEGDDPDHWFWALQVLTRQNPVSEDQEGNLRAMAKAWLDWAQLEGYAG